jgi:hypothetical protein
VWKNFPLRLCVSWNDIQPDTFTESIFTGRTGGFDICPEGMNCRCMPMAKSTVSAVSSKPAKPYGGFRGFPGARRSLRKEARGVSFSPERKRRPLDQQGFERPPSRKRERPEWR